MSVGYYDYQMSGKPYEEGSPVDLAHRALKKIQRYGESDDPKDRLLAFNVLLFVLVLAVSFVWWVQSGSNLFSIPFAVIFPLAVVFAAIVGLGYFPVLEATSSFSGRNLSGLRIAVVLEASALTVGWAGLLFDTTNLVKGSLGLLALQFFVVLFAGFANLPEGDGSSSSRSVFWSNLNRIANVITVGSFLVDALLVVVRYA